MYNDRFAKDPDDSDRRIRYIKKTAFTRKLYTKNCRGSNPHKIPGLE